ncbi:MAG: hypothetical protein VB996_16785 [Pseudomonadales bacterium]
MSRYLVLSFVLSVFISGCTVMPPVKPPPVDLTKAKIQQLLSSADAAMQQNRLTTPADDNAFDRYKLALTLNPSNTLAIAGINRIVERYLAWALDHAERSNLKKARYFVLLAEGIDPGHPNIKPVGNKINDQEDKVVSVFQLDATSVRDQSVDPTWFATIAARIQRHRAFITIRAPDDRSGRWLYQELNRQVDFRIEARFEISSNPSVSLTL